MEDPRYPIGKYIAQPFSEKLFEEWLTDIKFLPQHIENAILNLDDMQLETPYREGGWTVKQLVHHVADSHMNAYIRFKLRLTEDSLVIKPYNEKAWAEMNDTKKLPVNISLTLLHALHLRWHAVLKAMTPEDLDKIAVHPEHNKEFTLWELLGLYAWHGRHHVAHVTALREKNGW
ncbi:MAG: putative metal-dependent hydrolase [Chitinophagaceae bacterium]|nr:putative metal-dependent hydrolase [Chitinophagaceae bacterium]MBL0057226.1 putative metal-dependent hydrolase [Chitinophagaceae bacterium]